MMPKSKEFISSDDDSDHTTDEPKAKKKKPEKSPEKTEAGASKTKGSNGEVMFQLAKMRFVSPSEFRGKKYVNIREYYDADGTIKPGRKGIALNVDQWKRLKELIPEIDEALGDI